MERRRELYEITMSKSGDFTKSKPHLFFLADDNTFRNIHSIDQGLYFLDASGEKDALQWMVDEIDGTVGRIRRAIFIGHEGGFEGLTRIREKREGEKSHG